MVYFCHNYETYITTLVCIIFGTWKVVPQLHSHSSEMTFHDHLNRTESAYLFEGEAFSLKGFIDVLVTGYLWYVPLRCLFTVVSPKV